MSGKQLTNNDFVSYLRRHRDLDRINAAQNKITRFPYPDLLNFSQTLIHLNLENNKISDISEESIRQIPNIQLLKFRGNILTKLPDSLFSLASLKVLDVSCNRLTVFSPKVSLLRQLRLLNIAENQLENLPNSLGYLASLESITCEFFIYLADQRQSNNHQFKFTMPIMIDSELDWVTKFHRRMTMACNGSDLRFRRLMAFMRQ